MENNQNQNKISLSTVIAFGVLVLAIIGFFVVKSNKTDPVDSVIPSENSTTTESVQEATTTQDSAEESKTEIQPKPTTQIDSGVKVIQGDGFTATLKPVYGETPVINSFKMTKVDEVCRFSWDVSKAKRCDFLNSDTKTGLKDVGSSGTVQETNKASYLIKCYGDGGKSATSEVLSCN